MARQLIWIDSELGKKIKLFCFLRGLSIKKFATDSLENSLKPYQEWLENVQKLRGEEENDKNNVENFE